MAAGSGLGRKAGPGQFPRKNYPQQRSCKQSSKCSGAHQQPPGPGRHEQALALGHPREAPHREGLLKQRDGAPHARGDERNLCGAARLSAAGVAQHRGQRARLARFGRRPGGGRTFPSSVDTTSAGSNSSSEPRRVPATAQNAPGQQDASCCWPESTVGTSEGNERRYSPHRGTAVPPPHTHTVLTGHVSSPHSVLSGHVSSLLSPFRPSCGAASSHGGRRETGHALGLPTERSRTHGIQHREVTNDLRERFTTAMGHAGDSRDQMRTCANRFGLSFRHDASQPPPLCALPLRVSLR